MRHLYITILICSCTSSAPKQYSDKPIKDSVSNQSKYLACDLENSILFEVVDPYIETFRDVSPKDFDSTFSDRIIRKCVPRLSAIGNKITSCLKMRTSPVVRNIDVRMCMKYKDGKILQAIYMDSYGLFYDQNRKELFEDSVLYKLIQSEVLTNLSD